MKKLLTTLLLLFLTVATASAYFSVENDDGVRICYNINYGGTSVAVSSGYKYSGSVRIPSEVTYDGITYSVTSIYSHAFRDCTELSEVIFPETIAEIGYESFRGCTKLTTLTLPSSLKTIDIAAFEGCSNLKQINIPQSVENIGYSAFSGTSIIKDTSLRQNGMLVIDNCLIDVNYDVKGNVNIPNGTRLIAGCAFQSCNQITSIDIPSTVTSIGNAAFSGCRGLTSISLPNSIKTISTQTFTGCSNLNSIILPDDLISINSLAFNDCTELREIKIPNSVSKIGSYAFQNSGIYNDNSNWNDGLLYVDNCLIKADTEIEGQITIPEFTRLISEGAFVNCTKLTSVNIQAPINMIGFSTFSGCSSLKDLTMPNTITIIDDSAFSRCINLESIEIPNSVTLIGNSAFSSCSKLEKITIPNSVTTIYPFAFEYCEKLADIHIGDSVTTIGGYTFQNCSSLNEITIPQSVRYIGEFAFERCNNLTTVNFNASNCLIMHNYMDNFSSPYTIFGYNPPLTTINIGENVKRIPKYAFYNCRNINSITIPDSVSEIGKAAFYQCNSLTSLNIGNSVTLIEEDAFSYCTALSEVVIGKSVTSIGKLAFSKCNNLSTLNVLTSIPPCADKYSFSCYSTAQLNVPKGAKEAYETTEPWNHFVNIDDCLEADVPAPDPSLYDVHLVDTTVKKGVVNRVPLYLTNDEPIVSFNCDITLPEGLTLAQNSKGKYDIERGERCDDTFAIVSNDVNGNVRILCYSTVNSTLEDTDEPALYLPVVVDDSAERGAEFTVTIDGISMTTENLADVQCESTSAVLSLQKYVEGDVNGDGRYNSTDVSLAIQYVMELDAPNGIAEAADVNGDGRVNSTDVSLIISYVMEGRSPEMTRAATRAADVLSIYPEDLAVKKGETGYLPVVLNNPGMEVISFDCNIWLPEGVTIETKKDKPVFTLSDRADDHVITGNLLADGSYRVLLYSPTNSPIDGEEGVIFTIPIKVEADKGDYQLEIYGATVNELVDGEIVAHDCDAATSILTVKGETSAIEGLEIDADAEYYDLNGVRVKNPVKGLYLVRTAEGVKKVVIR